MEILDYNLMPEVDLLPRLATILEDEPDVRYFLEGALERLGYRVTPAKSCVNPQVVSNCLLQCCPQVAPALMVVAVLVHRPCSGIDVALKAVEQWPSVKVLLISASPTFVWPERVTERLKALPPRCCSFLQKPFAFDRLKAAIEDLASS